MKTINISDETYEKIKDQLLEEEKVEKLEDLIGKSFFFRTVTYHLIGKVERVFSNMLELSGASWVADSDRFMDAIVYGKLKEVEPVGTAYINIYSLTDFFPWKHRLPDAQK